MVSVKTAWPGREGDGGQPHVLEEAESAVKEKEKNGVRELGVERGWLPTAHLEPPSLDPPPRRRHAP